MTGSVSEGRRSPRIAKVRTLTDPKDYAVRINDEGFEIRLYELHQR